MKLVTFARAGRPEEEIGLWLSDGSVIPAAAAGVSAESMNELILTWNPETERKLKQALQHPEEAGEVLAPGETVLLSPIPRPLQDVLCLGLNYTEHAKEAFGYSESFTAEKAYPVFFSKRVGYSQGTGAPIPAHEEVTERLDYETELGVIIGRDAWRVPEEEVPKYIFGYTIVNDVSARDLQTRHKQWYFGKSLDGFTPMGPCIVTADEIAYPPKLKISTVVNGELRQNSTTDMLIHGISEIVSTLSFGMTLKAGSIIATGTPKGVVMGMDSLPFLKRGDVVECRIEGIGSLVNPVE